MEPEHVSPAEEPVDPTPAAAHAAPPAEDVVPTSDVDDAAEVDTSDAADVTEDEVDGPSVDELEGRLGDVEQAMAQIQSGQLDEAEASIASLDQRIGSASD